MKTRAIFILGSLMLSHGIPIKAQEKHPKPNFILILADDLGWTSTSVQMDPNYPASKSDYYQTPHIETMAEKGVCFTQAYAPAAICCPTRRSIQFGHTPARQGDIHFKKNYHPDKNENLTIPKMLKAVDPAYKSAHFGKWDLRAGFAPDALGYDESDGDTGNGDGNVKSDNIEKWTRYFINDDPKKIETLTSKGVDFMSRQVKNGNPFFLQISHYATHVDLQMKDQTLNKYWKKEPGKVHNHPGFAAMLDDLDSGIGKILEAVNRLDIADHTYIIFTTDNGGVEQLPQTGDKMRHPDEYGRPRLNHPLRGGKWTLYEGGIRVPFIVIGPGIKAGSYSRTPITGWDILPTLADMAGYEPALPQNIDGGSFKNVISDNHPEKITRPYPSLIFHRYNDHYPHSAIIKGDYKLVKLWKNNKTELYNLSNNIEENRDISAQHPEIVKELYNELITYFKNVDAEVLHKYEP